MLQLEFAVLEFGEGGGEKQRARLVAAFTGLRHRGLEPLRQARHGYAYRGGRRFLRRAAFILRFLRSLGFS